MSRYGNRVRRVLTGVLPVCFASTAWAGDAGAGVTDAHVSGTSEVELRANQLCGLPDVQALPAPADEARPRFPLKPLRANRGADVELRILFGRNGRPIDQRVCANTGDHEFTMAALNWGRAQPLRLAAVGDRTDWRQQVRAVRMRFDPQRELELRQQRPVGMHCPGYRDVFYPEELKRAGIEGVTAVRFRVEPDGRVVDVDVHRSSGSPVLDAAVVNHVKALACDSGNLSRAETVELEFEFALTAAERAAARERRMN